MLVMAQDDLSVFLWRLSPNSISKIEHWTLIDNAPLMVRFRMVRRWSRLGVPVSMLISDTLGCSGVFSTGYRY